MENKYWFIIGGGIFLLLVIGLIIFAATRNSEQENDSTGPTTLTVWRLFDNESILDPIFDKYKENHPNVTIQYEKKNIADYEEVFTNAIAGGKGPDIISLPNDWLIKHADKLIPAPERVASVDGLREKFVSIVADDVIIENKIYGMPLYADSLALYYNRDLFRATQNRLQQERPNGLTDAESLLLSGPPATWDDLVALVRLLTQKNGNTITVSGLAMGTADTTGSSAAILQALMLQNGAQMANVDNSAASFHLPDKTQTGTPYYPGTEALDFYSAFAKPDRTVYSWNNQLGSNLDAFMTAKAAMMINFQFVQQDIKQKAPTLLYDVAPLPQIKGSTSPANVASYMVEAVTKTSLNPNVAWDLVAFMTDPNISASYQTATGRPAPSRLSVEGNPEPFSNGIRRAKHIRKPDAKKYDGFFRDMIKAVIDLGQPPQSAIDVAANNVTKLLLEQP